MSSSIQLSWIRSWAWSDDDREWSPGAYRLQVLPAWAASLADGPGPANRALIIGVSSVALVPGGETVDDETVRKIMRDLGLVPCQPKPLRRSLTEQDGQAGPIPDLVNRDFTADKPARKMVGDITHIDTWEGWVSL